MVATKAVLSFNISARRVKSTSKTTPTAAQPLGVPAGACAHKDQTVTALRRKHRMYVRASGSVRASFFVNRCRFHVIVLLFVPHRSDVSGWQTAIRRKRQLANRAFLSRFHKVGHVATNTP